MFLLLSIPTAFLHFCSCAIFLTTQPLPHPMSRNENGLSKERLPKNLPTVTPCPFSISSDLPSVAHLSNTLAVLSIQVLPATIRLYLHSDNNLFDWHTILFLLEALANSMNVRTSISTKQSISPYNYWCYNHRVSTWSIFRCKVYSRVSSTYNSSYYCHHFWYIPFHTKFDCIQFNKKHQHDFYSACICNLHSAFNLSSRSGFSI